MALQGPLAESLAPEEPIEEPKSWRRSSAEIWALKAVQSMNVRLQDAEALAQLPAFLSHCQLQEQKTGVFCWQTGKLRWIRVRCLRPGTNLLSESANAPASTGS